MSEPPDPAPATHDLEFALGPVGVPEKRAAETAETVADEAPAADPLDPTIFDSPQADAATLAGVEAAGPAIADAGTVEIAAKAWCSTGSSTGGSLSGEEGASGPAFTLVDPVELIHDGGADDPLVLPPRIAGYEILGVLGHGAMGVVYKARQRGLRRLVALKMIRAGRHSGPNELARFRTEAVAVADLQHPNIVQIYEVGEDRGHPFFSLEYVDGESLARKINGTPQPAPEAARLVRALAGGMEFAHARGIVHRDLKPANILLTAGGEPKISDFGLVKRLEDDAGQTQSGSILGTPSYMAPEQAEGRIKEIGPRADVYGLGAVLYELLTGRPPFRAASILDTLQQVRTQEPIPPSQFQPKVPRDLETICLKCLQKDPAKRYLTAVGLGEDLRRYEAGEPILARPVGPAERLWRWCRRNRRVAALSGAVALLVVAWSVTSTLLYRLARAHERVAVANAETARRNEALARHNAETARQNEEQASKNAETARQNAERARSSEDLARRRAAVATTTARDAIAQMLRLGEQVLRRLLAKHAPERAEAEWLRLRDDLTAMLIEDVVPMAERIEGQEVTSFAVAATHQQLGDLLRKLGQGEDARRQYQQGYDVLARVAHVQPDNDQARANLALMLLRLGETAQDLDGDSKRARDEFRRAWDIQEQIALHPRSGHFKDVDNHRLLSHIALKLGVAELSLGHPTPARDQLQVALEHRTAWSRAQPQNVSARSYLSEAHVWLGVAHSHLDDWPAARDDFKQAIRICEDLTHQFPRDFSFQGDLAAVCGDYGDALARRGEDGEAETAFSRSLHHAEAVRDHDPEDLAPRLLVAAGHERLAAIALRRGKTADADRGWRTALEIRAELAQLEPRIVPFQAALALALARCGRRDEAVRKAEELFHAAALRPAVLLPLARCFAASAAGELDDKRRRRDLSRMLETLGAAIRNGYRDSVALRTDADFARFRNEPALQALLDSVKSSPK